MRIAFAVALFATVHLSAAADSTSVRASVQQTPASTRLVPADTTGTAKASGSIRGYDGRDFVIHAGAGQTLTIELRAGHPATYFNVLPPGSHDVAMFIGSTSGSRFRGMAPIAGDYRVRVYLMRSAARRNTVSSFTLSARVTGAALVPLSPGEDPVISGTPFHARATVRCSIPYQPDVRECEASVVRYGHDGTATVELRGPNGFLRRILFVKGSVAATDATEAPGCTRNGDTTTVRVGTEERYDLPDALVAGG